MSNPDKNRIFSLLNIINRFVNIGTSDGKLKVKYAIMQTICMALAVVVVYIGIAVLNNFDQSQFGKILILIILGIVLLAVAIELFLFGVVSQLILLVISIIHICMNRDKKLNAISLLIAILSFVAMIVTIILLVK